MLASLAARVSAAPIDVSVRLNPGQSGPVYAWSLMLRVDPGYEVGGVEFYTNGFDSVEFNFALPGISLMYCFYNPIPDGRKYIGVINSADGVALSAPGEEVLLATFFGPNRTSPPVFLSQLPQADSVAYDTHIAHRYPNAVVSLRVVPEPSHSALFALAFALFFALRCGIAGATLTC